MPFSLSVALARVALGIVAVIIGVWTGLGSWRASQAYRDARCTVVTRDLSRGSDGAWTGSVAIALDVDDARYERVLPLGSTGRDEAEIEALFPVGGTIACAYDPEAPKALRWRRPDFEASRFAIAFIGAIIAAMGILRVRALRRR